MIPDVYLGKHGVDEAVVKHMQRRQLRPNCAGRAQRVKAGKMQKAHQSAYTYLAVSWPEQQT